VVRDFGSLSAADLSILAAAIFLKSRFDTPEEELPQVVHNLKPKYSIENIENIIKSHTPKMAH